MSTAVRYRKTNTEAAGYLDVRSTYVIDFVFSPLDAV